MRLTQVGNKQEILDRLEEVGYLESKLNQVATMSPGQIQTWFDSHFSSLPEGVREGLQTIVEVIYANARVTKRLWLNK